MGTRQQRALLPIKAHVLSKSEGPVGIIDATGSMRSSSQSAIMRKDDKKGVLTAIAAIQYEELAHSKPV
jgi:hypothetical protein